MSLFTVTFESSDSDDIPAPMPVNLRIKPPITNGESSPENKKIYRRRITKKNDEVTVTKEKVDIYAMDLRPKESEIEKDVKRKKRSTAEDKEENKETNAIKNDADKKRRRRRRLQDKKENLNQNEENLDTYEEEKSSGSSGKSSVSAGEEEKSSSTSKQGSASLSTKEEATCKGVITDKKLVIPEPLSSTTKKVDLIKYKFEIDSSVTWKGYRIHMQLNLNGKPLFHSKIKSRTGIDEIPIAKGTECHFSDQNHEGVILVRDDNKSFSLRKNTRLGEEMATIRFKIFEEGEKKPRQCSVHSFTGGSDVPPDLFTRPFIQKPNGQWLMQLSGRSARPSIKNVVLVDKSNREWIIVLRTSESTLTIEASPNFDPLVVFAVGASSYMCK